MKNIVESIRTQLNDRLNSPLFGAFFISWICWNHRLLVVLFSDLEVLKRFDLIDSKLYPTTWEIWKRSLIWPSITATLFIYLYPIFSKIFYDYWLRKQRELKELRDKIEGATLLTHEESVAIRLEMIKIEDQYKETISRLSAEKEALKKNPVIDASALRERDDENVRWTKMENDLKRQEADATHLREQVKQLTTRAENAEKQLVTKQLTTEKGTIALIGMLAKNGGTMDFDSVLAEFHKQFNDSRVRVEYYIDEATRLRFVTDGTRFSEHAGHIKTLSLTAAGRRFSVEQKFA